MRGLRDHTRSTVLACLAALALVAGCARAPERPPNVVIVVLDTVRDDYAGERGTGASVTPNLDALALKGTTFTHAWATAPWTPPSHVSIFTGLLPSEHGCTGRNPRFADGIPTAAEILGSVGYETAAFYSNPWLTDQMTGMMRGFETQVIAGPNDARQVGLLSTRAQGGPETVRNVSEWLSRRDEGRPFLLFVNLLEAHLPYAPPPDYRASHPAELPPDDVVTARWAQEFNAGLHAPGEVDWERVEYLYAGDVATSDRLLGWLLELLEEQGFTDDTVVIVTSDHGENLGDHGFVDHQFGVFETLLAVPLVVRAPGRLEPGERSDPVMLTDIFATTLELAHVDLEGAPEHSRSLLWQPGPADRPLIAEYGGANEPLLETLAGLNPALDVGPLTPAYGTVRVGNLRLTVGSDGSVALHDLSSDPTQMTNVAADRPDDVEALLEHIPMLSNRSGQAPEIDERMREWLRALGYVM
ncbi:MAG: sulfatase [Candidatus Eisenbacteria bacterium]